MLLISLFPFYQHDCPCIWAGGFLDDTRYAFCIRMLVFLTMDAASSKTFTSLLMLPTKMIRQGALSFVYPSCALSKKLFRCFYFKSTDFRNKRIQVFSKRSFSLTTCHSSIYQWAIHCHCPDSFWRHFISRCSVGKSKKSLKDYVNSTVVRYFQHPWNATLQKDAFSFNDDFLCETSALSPLNYKSCFNTKSIELRPRRIDVRILLSGLIWWAAFWRANMCCCWLLGWPEAMLLAG